MSEPAQPATPISGRPPLVRKRDGRLVAGVARGIADHLGVNVTLVRVVFAVLAANGVGGLAYLALWLLVPGEEGAAPLRNLRDFVRAFLRWRPGDELHRRRKLIMYVAIGAVTGSILDATGVGFGSHSLLPLSVAGVGALLIWWRSPESQRAQWTQDAKRYGTKLAPRGPLLVMLGGVGLVIIGVASFLAANDALRQARDGALAIGAVLVGVALVTGPWLFRMFRDLNVERRARIREQERAEVAAHVHDSVLQTLALLQSQAADPDAVRRLARRQERELRDWLYPAASNPNGSSTFAAALRAAAADVEDAHSISVDVIVVGDAPLDDALTATVAAAREGMVNAAKSSGAPTVSVYAEVAKDGVEVFVRDRGKGFDPSQVPDDRRGIRESIVGRMTRHGGKADIRSGPAGTEVALSLPRQART
ncbi:MAG TPA: PspC domain-containing protein [Mycobacteriales bacterium]|nr:PspC domain-containing protein [Mycobacteriales bacterium]